MNVGSIQALLGSTQQLSSQAGNTTNGDMFGSVFNSILTGNPTSLAPLDENAMDSAMEETISTIFNATAIEEVVAALGTGNEVPVERLNNLRVDLDEIVQDDVLELNVKENRMVDFFKLHGLEQLIELVDMDVDQFITHIVELLEKTGLSDDELTAAMYVNDFWSLLNVIDKVAPQFFAEMANVLEGKGSIPKEQAAELLALLKSVAIAAPKMDLLIKQEQQVFSLQGFLAAASEQFALVPNPNQNKNHIAQLIETHHMRIVLHTELGQTTTNDGHSKESPKESVQQPVITPLPAMRNEMTLTELENRNNTRNEALLREMQNIFKRSNFGQTGGTNRLLIKLYPEHLGQVRIELLQVNGVMTARILASSALGKEMLSSQLDQLKAAFVQQNLQVDRVDVSQSLQDSSRNERDNAFNQHFKKEQEDTEEQQEQNSEDNMTFQEYMIELEA